MGTIPRMSSPRLWAFVAAAGRYRRAGHVAADGNAAAIGLDLLLGRAWLWLGHRVEINEGCPEPSDDNDEAATDQGQHPLVLLVLQKLPNLFPHDGTPHREDSSQPLNSRHREL
jgi:hypothetical protein